MSGDPSAESAERLVQAAGLAMPAEGFARISKQFMALHDAAEVLERLQPPNFELAAEFLREVGTAALRKTGLPEQLVQVMIRTRPPALDGDA